MLVFQRKESYCLYSRKKQQKKKGQKMLLSRISDFKGDHWFLSNYYPAPFSFEHKNGETYKVPTVVHAYNMSKTMDTVTVNLILNSKAPEAREIGRLIPREPNWVGIRQTVMANLVRAKFKQRKDLAERLIATGDAELIDSNYRGDDFWGFDLAKSKGENRLGFILMELRQDLKDRKEAKNG